MHQGLPWAGVVSAKSVDGGFETSSLTRTSSSYFLMISSNSRLSVVTISTNSSLHACDDDATLSILATTILIKNTHAKLLS